MKIKVSEEAKATMIRASVEGQLAAQDEEEGTETLDPPLTEEEAQIIRDLTGQPYIRFRWD